MSDAHACADAHANTDAHTNATADTDANPTTDTNADSNPHANTNSCTTRPVHTPPTAADNRITTSTRSRQSHRPPHHSQHPR